MCQERYACNKKIQKICAGGEETPAQKNANTGFGGLIAWVELSSTVECARVCESGCPALIWLAWFLRFNRFLFKRHEHALHRVAWFRRGRFSGSVQQVVVGGSCVAVAALSCHVSSFSSGCFALASASFGCGFSVSHFLLFVVECRCDLKVDGSAEAMIQPAINLSGNCGWEMTTSISSLRDHDHGESWIRERSIEVNKPTQPPWPMQVRSFRPRFALDRKPCGLSHSSRRRPFPEPCAAKRLS